MQKWKDELENAADKLQDFGKKIFEEASEGIEKVRPIVEEKLDQARETAKDAYNKARPAIEESVDKAMDSIRATYEKAAPVIEESLSKAAQSVKKAYERAADCLDDEISSVDVESVQGESEEAEEADEAVIETPPTVEEQIDLDVEKQMAEIRASRTAASPFADYISGKYGKKD